MSGKVAGECSAGRGTSRAGDLLRNRHRRLIVRGLWKGRVDHETDVMVRGSDADEVESDLRATHLPMLEEAGIVEWNRETGQVSKGPNFDQVEPLLELMEEGADELPTSGP